MSAIFGVVHWDGRPVASGDLARMDGALSAHGPDGGGVWRDGPVGLGHRLAHATPEDRFERQPLHFDGQKVLVVDARVDNRDELARAWSVGAGETREWADSAFAARALDVWGDEGPGRLRGAFALALWDGRARRLLLARSPLYERPLFYHASGRTFAFASMPKGLFALGVVTRVLDEPFLADFLALERFEPGATFYRGVRRLPAGHVLVVSDRGMREWPFWRPELVRELNLPTDEAYVEAFNEVYSRVVRDALRSSGPVGLMLSGGLDSSSVAATAAPALAEDGRRLRGFTQVPPAGFAGAIIPGRYADETPLVEELARRYPSIDLTFIRSEGRFFLDGLDQRYDVSELPTRGASNIVWWEALMGHAKGQGVRVLLHATGGNLTASWAGHGLLSQLLGRGHWSDALREARAISRANGATSPLRTLVGSGLMPWLPTPIHLGVQWLRSPRALPGRPWRLLSPVHPAFEAAHRVRARARAKGPDARARLRPDTRPLRRLMVQRVPDMIDGFFAGCQARFGLDVRDPTADPRLVEFCLSLPEGQYQRQGRSRWLVRRAFADRLPASILDNPRRGLQAADWLDRALRHRDRMFEDLAQLDRCDLARRAIDLARLRRFVERMPTIGAGDTRGMAEFSALELGLITGRFILWAEAAGPRP